MVTIPRWLLSATASYGRLSGAEWAVWATVLRHCYGEGAGREHAATAVIPIGEFIGDQSGHAERWTYTALKIVTSPVDVGTHVGSKVSPKLGHNMAKIVEVIAPGVSAYQVNTDWSLWGWPEGTDRSAILAAMDLPPPLVYATSTIRAAELLWRWFEWHDRTPCYRQLADPRWRSWLTAFGTSLGAGYSIAHIQTAIAHLDDEPWMRDRVFTNGPEAFLDLMPGLVLRAGRHARP